MSVGKKEPDHVSSKVETMCVPFWVPEVVVYKSLNCHLKIFTNIQLTGNMALNRWVMNVAPFLAACSAISSFAAEWPVI